MDKPKQYIQGWVEFYKLRFKVTPDVLIPRPETELLVDAVLDFLKTHPKSTILDLGTGAGNIAISIARNLRGHPWGGKLKIIATDISREALKVAQKNAKLHGVDEKIVFLESDLLSTFRHPGRKAELAPLDSRSINIDSDFRQNDNLVIVTNLPYIPTERIPYLDSSVKDYEPHIALDGGPDGFELYRKLFAQLKEKGWKPKLILGEIDYTHGQIAYDEATNFFPDAQVEVKTDLAHKQRILIITHQEALLRRL